MFMKYMILILLVIFSNALACDGTYVKAEGGYVIDGLGLNNDPYPYPGILTLGYKFERNNRFQWDLSIKHESSIGDKGADEFQRNFMAVGITVYLQ